MIQHTTHCFHCQEALPYDNPQRFSAVINHTTQYFCCPACIAVADAIHNLGLAQYYRQRDNKPLRPAITEATPEIIATSYQATVRSLTDSENEVQLFIPDIHCTSCCWLIEKSLLQLDGITAAHAQFHSQKLTVQWNNNALSLSDLLRTLHSIGYRTAPWQPSTQQVTTQSQQKKLLQRLGVAGLLTMQVHMVAMGSYFGAEPNIQHWLNVVALLLSLPLWFYCADIFFINAKRSLSTLFSRDRQRFAISMDIPIALAILAAALASIIAVIRGTDDVYFDSIAMFVFLLLAARFLEARARNRLAKSAQQPTLPQTCLRFCNEETETISIQQLNLHDCVMIKTGIIPVDGTVLHGYASVEQAIITGEFLSVQKQVGDTVIAGTTLISGELLVQAEHWGADSHIAHLHQGMEQALNHKQQFTNTQALYNTVAQFFTPAVLLLALGSALFWWWLDAARALPSFLAVLVASCPCAITLALPTALTAATLQLRRHGILITNNHVLQTLPNIFQYVFDKTGTLTQGRMHILDIQTHGNLSRNECLVLASAMEKYSTHPVASAFHSHPTSTQTFFSPPEITTVPHCGIEAKNGADTYRLGKREWVAAASHSYNSEAQNGIPIFLAKNSELLAVFLLGDTLRETTTQCISQLQQQHIRCTIASGDNSNAVTQIANTLSITDTHRNCTPEQKVQIIENLRKKNGAVLMIGDGVNDGPVLAHADISVALADASQTAQLAADVILLNNRLEDLLVLRHVALRTRNVVRQSLLWALLYNVSILPLAAIGWLAPVHAAIGMALSSLLVTLNALRLFPRTR